MPIFLIQDRRSYFRNEKKRDRDRSLEGREEADEREGCCGVPLVLRGLSSASGLPSSQIWTLFSP